MKEGRKQKEDNRFQKGFSKVMDLVAGLSSEEVLSEKGAQETWQLKKEGTSTHAINML